LADIFPYLAWGSWGVLSGAFICTTVVAPAVRNVLQAPPGQRGPEVASLAILSAGLIVTGAFIWFVAFYGPALLYNERYEQEEKKAKKEKRIRSGQSLSYEQLLRQNIPIYKPPQLKQMNKQHKIVFFAFLIGELLFNFFREKFR
jgi:hypothetical protein